MKKTKPTLYTCLSPSLLHLYGLRNNIVVIIDVLRATSTIAAALHNGAKAVIPVATVAECIKLGKQISAVTAGERDGQIAEGLQHGNSPFEYPREFIENKTLVLTTTNGTKLLHMALEKGAEEIITGAFANLANVCEYLAAQRRNVVLGCAAWKDKVNMEDTLFAGAVVNSVGEHFNIDCDASKMAGHLYGLAKHSPFAFMQSNDASHYHRLMGFGVEKDIVHCLASNTAPVLPVYREGKLVANF